ncbi:MAG: ABC transporter permease [Clostridium sp.]
MELFKFEVKKIVKSKKFFILWSIGFLLISAYAIMADRADNFIKDSEINIYEKLIEDLEINITSLNNQIEMENNNYVKESMKESIEESKESLELNKEIRSGILEGSSKKIIEGKLKLLKKQKIALELENSMSLMGKEEMNIEIEKLEYLLENNLEPINEGMNMNSINFINLVLKYIAPMLLGVIVILNTGDIVSKESDYGTIQTLLFRKITRKKIIMIKLLAVVIVNVMCFISILLMIAIILGIKNGSGSINYLNIVSVDSVLKLVPLGSLIIESFFITMAYIIFLSCLSILISILSKNSIESLCVLMTIVVGAIILCNNIDFPEWFKIINPFTYLAGNEIMQMGFSSTSILIDAKGELVVGIFFIYSILIILFSLWKFEKKEFNIES